MRNKTAQVKAVLRGLREPVTLFELSRLADVSPSTAGKWVRILAAEGIVRLKATGNAVIILPWGSRNVERKQA